VGRKADEGVGGKGEDETGREGKKVGLKGGLENGRAIASNTPSSKQLTGMREIKRVGAKKQG